MKTRLRSYPPTAPAIVDPAQVEGAIRQVLERESLTRAQAERVAPQVVQLTASLWQAPIPPPGILREYEDILPGCAENIISAFTSEVANRQKIERWQVILQGIGLACGVLVVLCMLAVAGYALFLGHPLVAAAIPATLAAVAAVFVVKQNSPPKKPPPPAKPLSRGERRNLAKANRR